MGSQGANRPSRIGGNRVSVSIFLSKRHRATSPLPPRLKSISFLLYSSLVVYLYYFNCSRLALAIPFSVKFNLPQGTCPYLTSSFTMASEGVPTQNPPSAPGRCFLAASVSIQMNCGLCCTIHRSGDTSVAAIHVCCTSVYDD